MLVIFQFIYQIKHYTNINYNFINYKINKKDCIAIEIKNIILVMFNKLLNYLNTY